ncbi:SAM-dependent methyltransferase [Patescibacteria group bacterium]|nr:SAM-dependent methyltransferase [Patescibacteria group bacterium]
MIVLVATVIGTIWVRVPFVPTSKKTSKVMLDAADLKGDETVFDLGAGDGRLLIRAKRAYPRIKAIGYEIVPVVWFLGFIRALFSRTGVQMKFGNAFKADVSDADCIFLYLITSLMPILKEKFDRELKPGTRVISHTFSFKDVKPVRTIDVPGLLGGRSKVYVYEW